jgi:hypothetical protein
MPRAFGAGADFMSEQWQIAILGAILTFLFYRLGQIDTIKQDLADTAVKTENRMATLENEGKNMREAIHELDAKAEKWFVLAGTAALHSPDDHLKADPEVERFVRLYKQHNHDLPLEKGSDWAYFRGVFIRMMESPDANPNEQALAEGYVELCEHKLSRDGLIQIRNKVMPE